MQLLGMANAWKGRQSTKSVLFPGASASDSTDLIPTTGLLTSQCCVPFDFYFHNDPKLYRPRDTLVYQAGPSCLKSLKQ